MTYYTEEKEYLVQGFMRDGTRCYNSIIKAKDKCSALLLGKQNNLNDRRCKIKWSVSAK